MTNTDSLIARIRAFRVATGQSPSGLALAAGLSNMALRRFDRPDWNPTADTLKRLEALIPDDWQAGDPPPPANQDAA